MMGFFDVFGVRARCRQRLSGGIETDGLFGESKRARLVAGRVRGVEGGDVAWGVTTAAFLCDGGGEQVPHPSEPNASTKAECWTTSRSSSANSRQLQRSNRQAKMPPRLRQPHLLRLSFVSCSTTA
jgi:hypothetical protein